MAVTSGTTRYELVKPTQARWVRRAITMAGGLAIVNIIWFHPVILTLSVALFAYGAWSIARSLNAYIDLHADELVLRGRYWATAAYSEIEGLREPGSNLPTNIDNLRKLYMKSPGMEQYRANVDLVFKRPRVVYTLPPWRMRVFPITIDGDVAAFCEDLSSRLAASTDDRERT